MREYKIRGKDIKTNEWVYGDLIQLPNGRKYIVNNKFGACIDDKGNFINTENPFVCEVIPETIGQYTSIKDKHKIEIYEGDIVKVSEEYGGYAYIPLVVDFENGCFILRPINNLLAYNPIFEYDFTQIYEVIGNKFDNPELMEF